jgi:hypothetical protein
LHPELSSIVGFGDYHYSYDSGREGDTFVVGFSPRKASLTLYLWTASRSTGISSIVSASTRPARPVSTSNRVHEKPGGSPVCVRLVSMRLGVVGDLDLHAQTSSTVGMIIGRRR